MGKILKANKTAHDAVAPLPSDLLNKPISESLQNAYVGPAKITPSQSCDYQEMKVVCEVPDATQDPRLDKGTVDLEQEDQEDQERYLDEGTLNQAISMVQLLADKMCERLAFERIITKLYEGLIAKCEIVGELESGPSIAELRLLRQDKVRNFLILKEIIEEIGGDPMELTGSAECALTATSGLPKVVQDNENSIAQALDAVLISELVDCEGWNVLLGVCKRLGRPDLAKRFEIALSRQSMHLQKMRHWAFAALV